MIETTDFLWPVCSPANLSEGEGVNAVNWRRRELCSPGCCGAVIANLLFCLPPWPSWGFPKPRTPLRSNFFPFLPLLPHFTIIVHGFVPCAGTLRNPFTNDRGKGATSLPLIPNPEVSYLLEGGFSFLERACAPAEPWAAPVVSC